MGFKSILKKVGKVAAIAAPIAAAPFTGGASLALIGAGAGAGHAALSGKGVKGILGGAALGSIPGVGKLATAGKLGQTAATVAKGVGVGSKATGVAGKVGKVKQVADIAGQVLGGARESAPAVPTGDARYRTPGIAAEAPIDRYSQLASQTMTQSRPTATRSVASRKAAMRNHLMGGRR